MIVKIHIVNKFQGIEEMSYQEWMWTDEFVTGQETVDYQHKILFNTINDLVRACNESLCLTKNKFVI